MALVFFRTDVLISKPVIFVFLYALLFYFMFQTAWIDRGELSKERIWSETIDLFAAISIFIYFIKTKDFKGLGLLALISLFFIVFSSVTSLIIISKFPMAARDITGQFGKLGNVNSVEKYTKLGLGDYSFFASLVFILPVIIGNIRSKKYNKVNIALLIFLIIFLFFVLIEAKYFANVLVGFSAIVFTILGKDKLNKSLLVSIIILFIAIILPTSFYINILNKSAELI